MGLKLFPFFFRRGLGYRAGVVFLEVVIDLESLMAALLTAALAPRLMLGLLPIGEIFFVDFTFYDLKSSRLLAWWSGTPLRKSCNTCS